MPHRVQSLKAEKEWASILEKNQVLERGNLAKEKSPKDILVFRLQWHGWSAYKTAGNKMDIQLQCSSKSQERVNIWTFEVLIGRKRGGSRWPSSPTLLPRLRLPGKPGDATHIETFSTNFLDFLPAHVVSSVGRWLSQPSSLELQHFLYAGQKFTLNPQQIQKEPDN